MTIISVSGLTLRFGTNTVFENVSFSLNENYKLGLVGVNGSGKSSLFKTILGEYDAEEGSVYISKEKTVGVLTQNGAFDLTDADGGEGADYGDPTMTEETPAPEPTVEPGEGFSEEGNLMTRDLLYDEHTNKQFITVQTSGGNTFYIVIDSDKPVDEEGEQYETYFFSIVDEADLLAAAEAAGVEQAVCSCSEKC